MNILINYYEQSLELAQKNKDQNAESIALGNLSSTHRRIGSYTKAIEYVQKALRIDESANDFYYMTYDYGDLGEIYTALSEHEKALEYFNKGLSLAIKTGDEDNESFFYERIGATYFYMKKYEVAIANIEKGIELNKKIGNTKRANSNLLTLGVTYADAGRKIEAHQSFQEVLIESRKTGRQNIEAKAAINIAKLYAEESDSMVAKMGINPTERHSKALTLATEALEFATKIGVKPDKMEALIVISTLHERNKNYVKAYDTYKQYISLKDSLSGDETKKQIMRKEIQFEFDKKETELKYQQQLTAGELEKQRLLTAQQEQDLLLNRQNLTLKEQALTLSNREKDLAHLAYLKEQAEKQEKAQQLSLSEEREKGKERDLSLKNLELSAQQKQNLYLGLLAAVLLGGLGTLFYFYNTLKKQKNIIAQQNELNEHTIAILSHDIKEPLLGVKLMLKKLNKDDPFVAQASQSLEGQINSVNGILTNLLKMKKLSLTKKDKNAQANAHAVVKNVLQELNVAIQSKELTVENDITEGVKLPIAPEKLQIIVHNLLSNAVKYSFPNQKIRIFNEGKGFCIQDFGVGLSPEQRSKLMREVTASQRGTNQEKGNGLGLFLIGAMLQGENIKVVFDSPEVGGTIVKVLG
ncbi:MAG: tetratricopeptide repeat protein [Saprospiraceae bacterium]|nr:tetratricopeptide repeat protein [Saprospiraceae bacterium]